MGLIIGVPVGAVGALCISRTLQYGAKSGFVTGLGCSVADCMYASVGAFGLRAVSDFLRLHEQLITLAGAFVIIGIGCSTIFRRSEAMSAITHTPSKAKMFFTSFCIGITNPGVVILFMVIFSNFGIEGRLTTGESVLLLLGFFAATLLWWVILIAVVELIEYKLGKGSTRGINKILGGIMVVLGIALLVKLAIKK